MFQWKMHGRTYCSTQKTFHGISRRYFSFYMRNCDASMHIHSKLKIIFRPEFCFLRNEYTLYFCNLRYCNFLKASHRMLCI